VYLVFFRHAYYIETFTKLWASTLNKIQYFPNNDIKFVTQRFLK